MRRGLRRVSLGRGGLRVNGRPLALNGRAVDECDEKQIAALHRAGCNLLLAETTARLTELLPLADVYGCFVMGVLKEAEPAPLDGAETPTDHPSFLGWLVKAPWNAGAIARLRGAGGALVGVEFGEFSDNALPDGVEFTACQAADAPELAGREATRPLLLLGDGPDLPAAFGRVE